MMKNRSLVLIRQGLTPRVIAALMICLFLAPASATPWMQDPAPDDLPEPARPTIQLGQQFLQQQDFVEAARIFEQVAKKQPTNGQAWFLLGYSLHAQGKLDLAMPAHLMAAEIIPGPGRATAMYNLACVYSLKDNADQAFVWLDKAMQAGFANNNNILATDTDMDNIRDDPRYQAYLDRPANPSGPRNIPGPVAVIDESVNVSASQPEKDYKSIDWASKPVRRQFDFWVGDWDAIGKDGNKVGANLITRRENGNIIHEAWTGPDGSTGQSINYFDPGDKKWKQVWVSQGGNVVYYTGAFRDGAMRYEGDNIKPDGTKVHAECTLTPLEDGRVHHHIRHTTDGGKTWKTYFDAHYVPRKK